MSEALVVTEPLEVPEPQRINVRMAMAGIYLTQGYGSLTRCLLEAGYSRATARNLQGNGLNAKRCLDEAAKLDPLASPAKLLEGGRRVLAEHIAFRDPRKMTTRDAVKLFEAVEKFHGGHAIAPGNSALGLADRLTQLVSYLVIAKERGLPVPSLPATFDVEVVATSAPQDVGLSPVWSEPITAKERNDASS